MSQFYFVAGASGSGKTSLIEPLKKILANHIVIYDFDDISVPADADKKWRQESTEKWLEKLLKDKKNACLLGQIVLGEILACPSASKLGKINFCLLDVSDFERIQRLKKRDRYGADQNMLNWAAWLRMHHQDPTWTQNVLKENAWEGLNFKVWDQLTQWDLNTHLKIVDTTHLSIPQTAESIANWIIEGNKQAGESIPQTPYMLYKNIDNAFEKIWL
jgi:energy-coupling factor transporter ATP-binding protein EcfA2